MEIALGMFHDAREENQEAMFGRIKSRDLRARELSTDFLQHLTAAEMRDLLGEEFNRYFRFAFVRSPWERMVSIYAYYRKVSGDTLSFREFLEQTVGQARYHHVAQHRFIFDHTGECLVDFVGRFENLANDFSEVCARLKVQRELPHIFAATIGAWRSYYDEEARKIVEQRFGEDIERFGYSF